MNKNKRNKVLIWSSSVSDLFEGKAYGIAVQLYFWAQAFVDNGWDVQTLTKGKSIVRGGIRLNKYIHWGKLEIIHEWLSIFWKLLTYRPKLLISRGADRVVYPLATIAHWFGVKYVLFGASDVNFEPGKELITGGMHNRLLWQKAIKKTQYIIVQNAYQQNTLKNNFNKDSLILFNIWGAKDGISNRSRQTDVVWVANFRRLKRAEWFLHAAMAMPEYDFTFVGGPSDKEHNYYEDIKEKANTIGNLHFLGGKSFIETNSIVSRSRLLCCTSTFEGFPNTFLQAWSNNVPVVSTVNPSDLITKYQLGKVVESEEGFQQQIRHLLQDESIYRTLQLCIGDYFAANHSSKVNFNKLLKYIDIV